MLANANNLKIYKPKNYKKATCHHFGYQKDVQKAIQDEIDSLSKNNTWSFSTIPSGSRALKIK